MSVFDWQYAQGYDELYREKDYVAECDLVERAITLARPGSSSRILDVGCGTGGHAIELARRGHRVTGVDLSQHMIDAARHKAEVLPTGGRPEFKLGNATSFDEREGGKYQAAIMMFAVLGYLNANEDILAALRNIRSHLEAGAPFVCDFWWGPAVLTQRPGERVRVVETWCGRLLRATRSTLDTMANTVDVHFDLYRFDADSPAVHSTETHRMRYFFALELELLFSAASLRIERVGQFPDLDAAPTDASWNAMLVASAV